MGAMKNFAVTQGKTFAPVLRWESGELVYKTITSIMSSAPARITAAAHGLVDGWRCAVTSVKGMVEINAPTVPAKNRDYMVATVIDENTIEFNKVNATGFKDYASHGVVQYNRPVDMAGYTARMSIKDKVGGAELLSLTTENGGIAIDNVAKTITLNMAAAQTAAFSWKKGIYELEMVSGDVVTTLIYGTVTVTKEVTT